MARESIQRAELDAILAAVESLGSKVTSEELRNATGMEAMSPKRFLTRLARLIRDGRLQRIGRTRGSFYALASHPSIKIADTAATEPLPVRLQDTPTALAGSLSGTATLGPVSATGFVYSTAAAECRAYLAQPVFSRRPVTYQRALLDAYTPNTTYYLPAEVRERLLKLGRTDGERQPAGTYARRVLERLLIDLSWNSSRLEGKDLSRLDTARLINEGGDLTGKDPKEAEKLRMVLNHKDAIQYLVAEAESIRFDRPTIEALQAFLANGTLPPEECGRVRRVPIGIGESVYRPLEDFQALEQLLDQLLLTADRIQDPIEQAFFALVHIPYLQAFSDGNKRTSRLAANIPFLRANLRPLSFVELPPNEYKAGIIAVYELNRVDLLAELFVWAYERSCADYDALRGAMAAGDGFDLLHRGKIREIVQRVVEEAPTEAAGRTMIESFAEEGLPLEVVPRFISVVLGTIRGMHAGNARVHGVSREQFQAWSQRWGGGWGVPPASEDSTR